MRKIIGGLIICIAVNSSCMTDNLRDALAYGAKAKVSFIVNDNDGIPVADACVFANFWLNTRKDGINRAKKYTDNNGLITFTKKSCNEVSYSVTKDGYYPTRNEYYLYRKDIATPIKDGKWQPYGAEIPVILKKIKNPVPMFTTTENDYHDIPKTNTIIGFDLAQNDWVVPYGKGEISDFSIRFQWDGGTVFNYKGSSLEIFFDSPHSGAYQISKDLYSTFISPYHADTRRTFENRLFYEEIEKNKIWENRKLPQDQLLILQTRTKIDEKGVLVSANYSKIYGIKFGWNSNGKGLFGLQYYFNPIPNDTNLEFDIHNNLNKKEKLQTSP